MKTILIVDDEQSLAVELGDNLKEDGYKIVLASNGEDGLRKVQLAKPDLIILDVMMPKMDGGTMFAKLKESEKTHEIPVIFLTALKSDVDDFLMGRNIGNYTIFSKPFDHEELLGTIREMTGA
jgi:DNA-binding response OmpR family regulator